MSDTDNESAFESADEGEEELCEDALSAKLQGLPLKENKICSHVSSVKNGTSMNVESKQASSSFANTVEQSDQCSSKNALGVTQLSGAECVMDEGLGDWDAGWEVDEDVLESACQITNGDNLKNNTPSTTSANEQLRSTLGESQVTPFEKLEEATHSKEQRLLDSLNDDSKKKPKQNSGWGWGSWGSSLLSTATSSVTALTSQVGSGLNSVIEGVEATLGAPPPEEIAVEHAAFKESDTLSQSKNNSCLSSELKGQSHSFFGSPISVGNIVSGVSSLTAALEQTSSKVITGSLDTLELIGRKTMDILQEGDPQLKKKRQFLKGAKPTLSEILREVRNRENEIKSTEESHEENQVHYSTIFDDFSGLVHLEALEMLSKESEQKVQVALLSHFGDDLKEMQSQLDKIKELYDSETSKDVDDCPNHEFSALVKNYVDGLKLKVNINKLLETQSKSHLWLQQCISDQEVKKTNDPQKIHDTAIIFMAKFTAMVVEIIHKASELYLLTTESNVIDDIQHFASFANITCAELAVQSSNYSDCLNMAAESEESNSVNPLITNVYLEGSNSSTYIQDACRLIVPVLQLTFVSHTTDSIN